MSGQSVQSAEREAAVREVALHGWTVARETARGYYVMRCSCGRHQTTMHKTPRLPDHFRNKEQGGLDDQAVLNATRGW